MKLKQKLGGGVALAFALASPALAADKVKVGLITKFPVPFFSTIEDAAKKYASETTSNWSSARGNRQRISKGRSL